MANIQDFIGHVLLHRCTYESDGIDCAGFNAFSPAGVASKSLELTVGRRSSVGRLAGS